MILELLSLCDDRSEHMRITISEFIIEFLECLDAYEYDLTQNSRNMDRISTALPYLDTIITKNRLYLLELNNFFFINQFVKV